MNVDKLKPGTMLMWDAPEPFDGYAKQCYNRDDHRIIYPCIVTNQTPRNNSLTCHIKTKSGQGNWMCGEQENLRYPTEEELQTLTWTTYE